MPLSDAKRISWQCQSLLSVLIGEPLSTRGESITAKGGSSGETADLVYSQIGRHDREDLHPLRMFYPYERVRDQLQDMVTLWMSRSPQSVLATDTFLGIRQAVGQRLDVRFVSMVHVAECYHRGLSAGLYMDPEVYTNSVYRPLVDQIPAIAEGDHRQSLKNRLKYGNEYSLRKRLGDLLGRIPEDAREAISRAKGDFVNGVVDTRNYLTHFTEELRKKALGGRNLYVAGLRIETLVVANILLDLGVPKEGLLEGLRRSREVEYGLNEPLVV